MDTSIGTKFEHLTPEETAELAPLLNELGDRYLHTYEDGSSEIKANPVIVDTPEEEIWKLKRYLTSTDYTVIKCMERGLSVADTYPEVYQKREEARERINELEVLAAANEEDK